jgi:integrase
MHDLTKHTIHDLRHTYCTRAAQAGVNPKVLQTITGHKKIETLLKIYTHVSDQDRTDAAAKISAYCTTVAQMTKMSKNS